MNFCYKSSDRSLIFPWTLTWTGQMKFFFFFNAIVPQFNNGLEPLPFVSVWVCVKASELDVFLTSPTCAYQASAKGQEDNYKWNW